MTTARVLKSMLSASALLGVMLHVSARAEEAPAKDSRPKDITFKKSWICIVPPASDKPVKEGEEFKVTVKYYLDASENWGEGTKLCLVPLGPWIDCPDGKYTKDRHHESYPGLYTQEAKVEPGAGSHEFSLKASKLFKHNGLLLLAIFKGGDGKNWPWEIRSGGPTLVRDEKFYQLSTGKPGSLFVYEEPVQLKIEFKEGSVKGESKTLKYKLFDTQGNEAGSGEHAFTTGYKDDSTQFTVDIKERGTFLLEAQVEGWGARDATFARIPDVMKITGGAKTQLAATNLHSDAECKIARMLGFTAVRQFFDWKSVQPSQNTWNYDEWDKILETNKKNGIEPWLCIVSPPPWVMTCPAGDVGFEPFPFDEAAWRSSVEAMTKRWNDKLLGWEWLNEIVPGGKSKTPSEDYARFCEIGTDAVKKINPAMKTLMAGGLWPRNFRTDCLNAGVGKNIDVLPVHYSDMGGVLDAIDDLNAAQNSKVVVWDDETGNGASIWNMPPREALQIRSQSQWCLDHWPDELVAGAEKICYFGGWTDPAGNWSCLLDEHTPRPAAATIAVLASKIANAKPIGKFYLGEHGVFHLFEKDGKAILVASSSAEKGEKIDLNAGAETLVATDYQGKETPLKAAGGKLSVDLSAMRIFIEGADLDALKSYCAVAVGSGQRVEENPKVTVLKGLPTKVQVAVKGLYENGLEGTVTVRVPDGWPAAAPVGFSTAAGKRDQLEIPLTVPEGAAPGEFSLKVEVDFKNTKLPKLEKPVGLSLISREMVGNLIKNGDFETAGATENTAAEWGFYGKGITRHPSGGGLGLGSSVLRFENAANYESCSQARDLPPGRTYLYSAWIWNENMGGGSNLSHNLTDGKSNSFYTPSVFMTGNESTSWHLYSCKTDAPRNLKSISFSPVVKGPGWAMYDNLRVSLYEGSNYTAECPRAKTPIKIDGKLDDWNKSCPIPLLCENQITLHDKSYKWTPNNLSGVAYLQWDEKFLYFAAEVKDDVHFAKTTGDETLTGDSIALGIHPANRAAGKDDKAFVYYLSSASPGGGSGACTLYRPAAHSGGGGLSSGQLAKDSSVYEIVIHTEGSTTIYELKMPWSELGGINPAFGTKIGLSLLLNDNDGAGKAATMSWGDGLISGWTPTNFGIATLVDP